MRGMMMEDRRDRRGEETLGKKINESWSLMEETRLIISRFNKQIAWEVTPNSCSSFVTPLSRQWPYSSRDIRKLVFIIRS